MDETQKLQEFQKDLQELLNKYEYALYAIPAYGQDNAGIWHPSAEIKIVPVPQAPVPLPKDDIISQA